LRYLYNTSLAYGAQGISDFVYYYPEFTGGMMNADGTTTTLYDAAKTANHEFESIAEQVQSLVHIGAYHLGDLPPGYGTSDGSSPLRLPSDSPFKITPNIADTSFRSNKPVRGVVMGLFGPKDDLADATRAVVVNLDYSNSLTTRVTGSKDISVFDTATGRWIAQGHAWADVTLEPGGTVLVGLTATVLEPSAPMACIRWRNRIAARNGAKGWRRNKWGTVPIASIYGSSGTRENGWRGN
jgi:hypothetical protein